MRVAFPEVTRKRDGTTEAMLDAQTLGELVITLASKFPRLAELVEDNRLRSAPVRILLSMAG
jgi:hypothetical protein